MEASSPCSAADPTSVGDQRLLLVRQRLGGRAQPLLGLLEFLAVLGQRRGRLDGDPVPFGFQPGAQFRCLRPGGRDGSFRLGPGVRPDLIRVPP